MYVHKLTYLCHYLDAIETFWLYLIHLSNQLSFKLESISNTAEGHQESIYSTFLDQFQEDLVFTFEIK